MRIAGIEAIPLSCPIRPMRHAGFGMDARTMVLVRITTDAGVVGYGEAGCVDSDPTVVAALIDRELAPVVTGRDPMARLVLYGDMCRATKAHGGQGIVMHAISGVDMALWDLCGRSLGVPVWRLLGGCNPNVPVYATAGLYRKGWGIDGLCREMTVLAARGYRAVKVKVGLDPDDVRRVRAVGDALGDGVGLMIDANGAYKPKEALALMDGLSGVPLVFFEEPVDPAWPRGLAEFRSKCPVPVAGGENLSTLPSYLELLGAGAVDMIQADSTRSGGITALQGVAALAEAHRVRFALHSFSSVIGMTANLHVAAALGCAWSEVDGTDNPLMQGLALDPPTLRSDGTMAAPDLPGLGLEPDETFVDTYRV